MKSEEIRKATKIGRIVNAFLSVNVFSYLRWVMQYEQMTGIRIHVLFLPIFSLKQNMEQSERKNKMLCVWLQIGETGRVPRFSAGFYPRQFSCTRQTS